MDHPSLTPAPSMDLTEIELPSTPLCGEEKEKERTNPPPPANPQEKERVLQIDRHIVQVESFDKVFTDEPALVNDIQTVEELRAKAICANLFFVAQGEKVYEGQASLLESPDGLVTFCTAKHNVLQRRDELYVSMLAYTPTGAMALPIMTLPAADDVQRVLLRDNVWWATGVDVLFGPSMYHLHTNGTTADANFLEVVQPFKVVPDNFSYTIGQKVGMVLYSQGGRCLAGLANELSGGCVPTARDTLIVTGEITAIGELHIEHNMNTTGGDSGAVIFLLEDGEEHGDGAEDRGAVEPTEGGGNFLKAIAVHAGYHSGLEQNIGFKIAGKVQTTALPKADAMSEGRLEAIHGDDGEVGRCLESGISSLRMQQWQRRGSCVTDSGNIAPGA